jgi:hypothetical protein
MKKHFSRVNTKYGIFGFILVGVFFVIGTLLTIFTENIGGKVCSIILTCIILSMLLFDLLYLQTFTFYDDGFKTNYLINTDVEEYKSKLLKKVFIKYKDIKKIEERTKEKHKIIYLYTQDDEVISIDVEYHFKKIYKLLKNNIN